MISEAKLSYHLFSLKFKNVVAVQADQHKTAVLLGYYCTFTEGQPTWSNNSDSTYAVINDAQNYQLMNYVMFNTGRTYMLI